MTTRLRYRSYIEYHRIVEEAIDAVLAVARRIPEPGRGVFLEDVYGSLERHAETYRKEGWARLEAALVEHEHDTHPLLAGVFADIRRRDKACNCDSQSEGCPECLPTHQEVKEAYDAWYHGLPGCERAHLRSVDYRRGWDAAVTWMVEKMANDKSG